MLVAAGLGRRLRNIARLGKLYASDQLVVDTSLGLGLLSLLLFAMSAVQLLRPIPGIVLAVSIAAVSIPGLPGIWQDLRTVLSRVKGAGLWSCLAAELLIVIAIAALIPALAPPSMGDWDSLAYHLAVPKLYIQHGGFYYVPFTTHSNFPFLMEMLYIPGLALNDPVAAKLMHYWMGVLLVGAVVVLTRRHVTPRAAPMAAIAVAGMPIVMWEATTAYVDLATALYTVLGVHLVLNYLDSRDRSDMIACGLTAGFAASTKMTGLALIPMLAVWMLAGRIRDWKPALKFCAIAALACVPWYAKSMVCTGSPVYPFFYSLFGGRDWTQQLADNYTMLQKHFGLGHNALSFLLLPYNLTFRSEAFYDRPGLFVGPLMLVALPVLVFAKYGSGKLKGMLIFFIAQMALWFELSQQSRYLIPGFTILAALVAGLVHLDNRLKQTRSMLTAAFVATSVFGLVVIQWPAIRDTAGEALGAESREAYLARRLDIYPAQQFINANLPGDARVALFGDTRGFYLDRPYVWADWGHNVMFSRSFDSARDLSGYLKSNGFSYAMVNFGVAFPGRRKATGTARMVYEAIENGCFQQVYPLGQSGSVAVYKIRE